MARLANLLILSLALYCIHSGVAAQSANPQSENVGALTIRGRVVFRGKGLEGAVITLWRQPLAEPTAGNVAATSRTDGDGKYELTNVATGNYFIAATATGFVTGKENQIFANLRYVVVVGSEAIGGLDLDMVPEGVIKGTVTDADGKPVARTPINIFPEGLAPADAVPPPYARDIRTDEQGTIGLRVCRLGGIGLPPVTRTQQLRRSLAARGTGERSTPRQPTKGMLALSRLQQVQK